MDKILFIRQNPKDFTCEEHYSSLKRIFKHGINLLGLLLLFLFVNITFVHAQAVKLSLNKQNATYGLNTLGSVNDHDSGVSRHQGTVSIL